jgi:hypothetical protein
MIHFEIVLEADWTLKLPFSEALYNNAEYSLALVLFNIVFLFLLNSWLQEVRQDFVCKVVQVTFT